MLFFELLSKWGLEEEAIQGAWLGEQIAGYFFGEFD